MKKLKYLVLLLVAVVLPFVVYAEEGDDTLIAQDNRAIVYFFHGDGCPHCEEARTWFNSIQEEYGDKYKLVEYEVWNNADNAALMQKISDGREDNATGVPYILCGDKSWIGFDEQSMASEITAAIDEVFATDVDARYDAVALFGDAKVAEEEKPNDVLALIIILLIAGGIGYGIYRARKSSN